MDDGSQKMFQQYLKLAEQGVSWAQTCVGSIYLHYLRGSPFQIPCSIALGLEWLKRAAKKGDPQALYNLGCLSLPKVPEGKGHHPVLGADAEVPASFENVRMYWELAAQAGHVDAMHRLGYLYLDSRKFDKEGTKDHHQDLIKSKKWLMAAGEHGAVEAKDMAQQLHESTSNSNPFKRCNNCGTQRRRSNFKNCSRCHCGLYCDKACFKEHWKTHKKVCKKKNQK